MVAFSTCTLLVALTLQTAVKERVLCKSSMWKMKTYG